MTLVLRNAVWLVVAGLAIGAPIAWWSKGVAASVLENLTSGGALPIAAAGVAMIGVALLAACVPVDAQRASSRSRRCARSSVPAAGFQLPARRLIRPVYDRAALARVCRAGRMARRLLAADS